MTLVRPSQTYLPPCLFLPSSCAFLPACLVYITSSLRTYSHSVPAVPSLCLIRNATLHSLTHSLTPPPARPPCLPACLPLFYLHSATNTLSLHIRHHITAI
jgi:hypothetical protein